MGNNWLLIPYIANIVILIPVCTSVLFGTGEAVFEGKVAESEGFRLLVGSLWTAILIASIAGLWKPGYFAPIILAQIIYKSLWLILFIAPQLAAGNAIPLGISLTFAVIVVTYPVFFALSLSNG